MISPRQSYIAGSHLTSVGVYFNQALMASKLARNEDDHVQKQAKAWLKHLKKVSPRFTEMILRVTKIAKDMGLKNIIRPGRPKEYIAWSNQLHTFFNAQIKDSQFNTDLYNYGFCQGETLTTLAILCTCADFQRKLGVDFEKEIQNSISDLDKIFTKWEEVGKSIGQLKQYRMYSREWKRLNSLYQNIRNAELNKIDNDSLKEATPKLRELSEQIGVADRDLLNLLPGEGTSTVETE